MLLLVLTVAAGCRQEMAEQPSLRPLVATTAFADGRAAQTLVPGTIPRLEEGFDDETLTGMRGTVDAAEQLTVDRNDLEKRPYLDRFPRAMTAEVLRRGRERYMVFCVPCHDPLGYGTGVVVDRGYTRPPTLHSDRLRAAPPGYFYDVIRRGFGAMPEYGPQIPVLDRWAIAGHIKVLQQSQHLRLDDLPEPQRRAVLEQLEKSDGKR
jgi:hypothetical protein